MSAVPSSDAKARFSIGPTARLSDIEAFLEAHFQRLTARKNENDRAVPLFAIEHGLDIETVASLGHRLGSSLGDLGYMSDKHRLAWVVHAAEKGYSFGGLEYWDSFSEATPNWRQRGDRNTLRDYFSYFAKRFNGVQPAGGWAERYKYICWPIAHALLPRDLQVQLAQAIYRARHHLYIALRQPDDVLGRLVAHFAYYPTHRFSLFLRDGQLAGWIVRTLLRGEHEQSGIEPQTLSRIVSDLRSESHARAWLTESRGVYQQHSVRPYGGCLGMPPLPWLSENRNPAQAEPFSSRQEAGLEPRLSMIRTAADEWMPVVTIPSFMPLAADNEELLQHLETCLVSLPSHSAKMGPASALLSPAGLERPLSTWPNERTPLLKFDRALPVFDDIVKSGCQLKPGSLWLFKVGSDGIARQVLGAVVRPGEQYVLVSRDDAKIPASWTAQRLTCTGVTAAAVSIPEQLTPAFESRLQQAGLSVALGVTLSPIGVVPIGWSPQSLGEWLTTQSPCFLLRRDHDFTHYSVRLHGGASTVIACGPTPEQYICLQGLEVGRHSVVIETHANAPQAGASAKVLRSVTLSISIRQPRTWTPGRLPLPAMLVTCNPASPTFSDFISGRITFRVDGDSSREVCVHLDLLDGVGVVISSVQICKQRLPVESRDFREAIGRALSCSGDDLDFLAFDAAQVVVDGGDLGLRKIVLQQAVQPLRWRYSQQRSNAELVLIDDLENSVVRIRHAPFARPADWRTVPLHQAAAGLNVTSSHGLYVATNANQESCVVVSPTVSGRGFDMFRVNIESVDLPRRIGDTLETYRLWSSARVCGLVSRQRQRQVLHALYEHGIGLIAGHQWKALEQSLPHAPSQADWERLEAFAHRGTNYGVMLANAWATSSASGSSLEDQFVNITVRMGLAEDPGIARCAWRLAGGFQGLSTGDIADASYNYDRKLGSSMRGARLLRLFAEKNRSVTAMELACKS